MAQSAKKIFNYTFYGGKHPFDDEGKLFFLPRTPDFYLCPKIPGGGKRTTAPPVYATVSETNFRIHLTPMRRFLLKRNYQ